jgi:hypothetical protein
MTRIIPQPRQSTSTPVAKYTGHVTYIFAYDIAYELARTPLQTLMGQPVAQFQMDSNKRAPRQLFFYRPQMVRLPPLERIGPQGPVRVERQVKLFSVGAISISVRVPFEVNSITELVRFHDLRFNDGTTIHDDVLSIAEDVRRELAPRLVRPVDRLSEEEAYTVFCITSPLDTPEGKHVATEDWLDQNRRQVAALLTEEDEQDHLSGQESDESTSRYLSYYDHDMVVVDWDAALIIDEPRYIDEMVYLMELANLQLAELEAYDRILDNVVDRSYRDLSSNNSIRSLRRGTGGGGAKTLKDLREIRIDLARMSDELSNITKFFGDWHLARIYQAVSSRFHLPEWHKTIDEKLKTLDDLYQLLQSDRFNRYLLILELTMCLLFVIDVILLIRGAR